MSTLKVTNIQDTSGGNNSTSEEIYNGRVKAWVNFNGDGTVAIRADFNVNTIADRGTGLYAINFTDSMSDTNFSAVGSNIGVDGTGGSYGFVAGDGNNTNTTSQVSVAYIAHNATFFDQNRICVHVIR